MSSIQVKYFDDESTKARFKAVAVVDRRQRGWLVANECREFSVPEGEHEVVLHFSKNTEVRLEVTTTCDRDALLICGKSRFWMRYQRSRARRQGIIAMTTGLALLLTTLSTNQLALFFYHADHFRLRLVCAIVATMLACMAQAWWFDRKDSRHETNLRKLIGWRYWLLCITSKSARADGLTDPISSSHTAAPDPT